MTLTRVPFQTAMRAAAVSFLEDVRTELGIPLQIYRARPATIAPPTAFVDTLTEDLNYTALNQRVPRAEVLVLHGIFDHGETVDQRDRFVDAIVDLVIQDIHRAHANTTVAVVELADEPTYVPDWIAVQKTYYATRLTLEGRYTTG
jgi:hypothetical protein